MGMVNSNSPRGRIFLPVAWGFSSIGAGIFGAIHRRSTAQTVCFKTKNDIFLNSTTSGVSEFDRLHHGPCTGASIRAPALASQHQCFSRQKSNLVVLISRTTWGIMNSGIQAFHMVNSELSAGFIYIFF